MILPCLLLLGVKIVQNSEVNVKIEAFAEPDDCQGFLDKFEVRPLENTNDNNFATITSVEG